jgi:hypothetical protein
MSGYALVITVAAALLKAVEVTYKGDVR